ncbi:MAG: flavodoxin family protein [Archaeoglobales archaeon]|nr:flavodoxin family protein [Archaeoglobales archaeon]
MRALAILGSPRRYGNTAILTEAVLDELESLGYKKNLIYLQEKNIKYCLGCGTCLMKGYCIHKDDMQEIIEEIKRCRVLILASPVYYLNVTAQMKTFIDRMLAFGHRPSLGGYGASITVYAGVGNAENVARYLNRILKSWGIVPVGYLTAYAVLPGEVCEENIKAAKELGKKIAKAVDDKMASEITEEDLKLRDQLINLIKKYRGIMKADYEFWKEKIPKDST